MQAVGIAGLALLPVTYGAAWKLAKPVFDQRAVSQRDRLHVHGLWMSFWMLGILIGLLPLFVSA